MTINQTALPDPTDIVMVPFYCQARYAPELQQAGAELLRRLASKEGGSQFVPPYKSTDGEKDPWAAIEWSNPEDEDAARWLMNDLPDNQRRILVRLIAAGADGITTSAVLAFGGYGPETSASPVFKAIGGRFRRVGRRPVWRGGEQTSSGQVLPVPEGPVRDLFVSVLISDHHDLAVEVGLVT